VADGGFDAARGQGALIFPPLTYALTEFAASFAGTVSIGQETAQAFVTDLLAGIAAHRFSRIAAVNHHLEPDHFALVRRAAKAAAARSGR
jgi:creatinine amidohydrolase